MVPIYVLRHFPDLWGKVVFTDQFVGFLVQTVVDERCSYVTSAAEASFAS